MAKIPKIIFGNKEKKQFPDPEGLEREKPSSAIEGSTQPTGFETNRSRNKFSEAAPPMPGARQTLNNRLQRVGSVRRGVSLAAPRKEEVDGNMENKTFTQFVTEAKRGRPRKLRPGEQADTEHLQDQLSKLTHANKALIHLSGLKPIHRADHVEHMHQSKENFYHTLATKSIPSKKKTITLAGPKLRKEEAEQIDELSIYKMQAISKEASRRNKDYSDPKGIKHQVYGTEVADDKIVKKAGKYNPSTVTKVVDKIKDKLKGMSMKKKMAEEVESDEKKKKDHHKLLQKFRYRIDEVKAIKGTHATKLHAAKVIHPDKVGYAGKGTKPKVQNLRREDYAPLEDGEKQVHVDQKTVDAKTRKQGAEKPKKPKMELTKEAWALYDTLSDKNKAIFEKMDAAERDALVDKYISGKR